VVVQEDVETAHRHDDFATRVASPRVSALPGLDFTDVFDDLD